MKYLKQLAILLVISLIGEALGFFIPLPVPASVYGLVILFVLLCTKVLKLEDVEDTTDFLISIMPFFFVGPTVGLMQSFGLIKGRVLVLIVSCFLSAVTVIVVTGLVSQFIIRLRKKKKEAR